MDKKIVGLIAAVSGLGTIGAAQANTPAVDVDRVMNAQSFSELLEPIANAAAILKADDEGRAAAPDTSNIQVAQWHHHHHHHYYHHHHHHHYYHHHHHHNWWWWHHHHHHHWY
jgi:hypothetical protein